MSKDEVDPVTARNTLNSAEKCGVWNQPGFRMWYWKELQWNLSHTTTLALKKKWSFVTGCVCMYSCGKKKFSPRENGSTIKSNLGYKYLPYYPPGTNFIFYKCSRFNRFGCSFFLKLYSQCKTNNPCSVESRSYSCNSSWGHFSIGISLNLQPHVNSVNGIATYKYSFYISDILNVTTKARLENSPPNKSISIFTVIND